MSLAWFNMLTCLRLVAWICYIWHLTQFGSWSQANAERERALESVHWPKAVWEASGGHRGYWPPARGSDSNIFRRKSVVYAANRRSETHEAQTQTLNKRCSGSAVCGSSMLAGWIDHPDPPGANWSLHRLGPRHAGIAVRVSGKNNGEHPLIPDSNRPENDKSAPNGPEWEQLREQTSIHHRHKRINPLMITRPVSV